MESVADILKYKGVMTLTLRDSKTNDIKAHRKLNNIFLNVGKVWAIQRLFDDTASVVSGTAAQCFYVGTSTSGIATLTATDTTASNTEVGRLTFTYQTGAVAGAMSGTATFNTSTANAAITEAGIFAGGTTSGDGVFICRALFSAINKTSSDTLQVKWDVSIA